MIESKYRIGTLELVTQVMSEATVATPFEYTVPEGKKMMPSLLLINTSGGAVVVNPTVERPDGTIVRMLNTAGGTSSLANNSTLVPVGCHYLLLESGSIIRTSIDVNSIGVVLTGYLIDEDDDRLQYFSINGFSAGENILDTGDYRRIPVHIDTYEGTVFSPAGVYPRRTINTGYVMIIQNNSASGTSVFLNIRDKQTQEILAKYSISVTASGWGFHSATLFLTEGQEMFFTTVDGLANPNLILYTCPTLRLEHKIIATG